MSGLGESLEVKGFEKGKLAQLIELVLSGNLTEERAAQKAGMTPEEFHKKLQQEKH